MWISSENSTGIGLLMLTVMFLVGTCLWQKKKSLRMFKGIFEMVEGNLLRKQHQKLQYQLYVVTLFSILQGQRVNKEMYVVCCYLSPSTGCSQKEASWKVEKTPWHSFAWQYASTSINPYQRVPWCHNMTTLEDPP